jgi:uncharacterized membrane protein
MLLDPAGQRLLFLWSIDMTRAMNVRNIVRLITGSLLILASLAAPGRRLYAQSEVVRVVLFFAPTCPHCHEVIQDHLPIFFDIYGGEPRLWTDQSVPDGEGSLYLMYNEQLEVLLVDVTRPLGGRLFVADLESHGIPPERGGVPRMVFGDAVLVGSFEIPSQFHSLMRQAQAHGGLDWPAISGLGPVVTRFPTATSEAADSDVVTAAATPDSVAPSEADTSNAISDTVVTAAVPVSTSDTSGVIDRDVAAGQHTRPDTAVRAATRTPARSEQDLAPVAADTGVLDEPAPMATGTVVDSAVDSAVSLGPVPDSAASPFDIVPRGRPTTMLENLQRDPVGNTFAIIVLLGMVASMVVIPAMRGQLKDQWSKPPFAILVVAVLGIVVAGYLSYVETSGATAVCGPVGDCNTVQQSRYAVLFGLVPVGVLGLLAYIGIIAMWFMARLGSPAIADYAGFLLLVTALVGTLFSIYLTFLEPFVIGAICAWCLASSVAITVLLWLSASSGRAAWVRLGKRRLNRL